MADAIPLIRKTAQVAAAIRDAEPPLGMAGGAAFPAAASDAILRAARTGWSEMPLQGAAA
ncbi:hypothetical protein [Frigidibacter mobilis]|uniref:Uncharacterized protein n=1 Tax=Frigidibacter mobilis TaxID=1335048 RepID=A0A165STL5_9RHOB|nr:hypothetical protein [Frigidibacter mobilis]AMY70943.1 hypothetical protein AKL17_3720 [Frigidibacter mobilis]